jgi:hypothetical protein
MIVIVTPGIGSPLALRTVPEIVPPDAWPDDGAVQKKKMASAAQKIGNGDRG